MRRISHPPAMAAVICFLGLTGLSIAAPAEAQRPNVVYFIIDELGYYEQSGMGHPTHRTPNMDKIMAEGTRFTQCMAGGPVCAPTRCTLLTGKHAGHMTVRGNDGAEPLRAGEATLGSMMKQAGYATGGFGKWGNGSRGTSGVPETHGFDVFFGYYDQVHAHTFFPRYLIRNSQEVPLAGNTGNTRVGQTFSQYEIANEAKNFIRQNKDRPFFAYCCFTPPHGQWGMPENDPSWQAYKDLPLNIDDQETLTDARMYTAMINLVDRQIGEIRDLLAELNLAENTIIFLTGDNGAARYFGDDSNYPDGVFSPNVNPKTGVRFRGYKGQLYEGGLRVPFVAHWPGHFVTDRASDHLAAFYDVMPTLADLTGAECPSDRDGISFAPTLLGEGVAGQAQAQHEYLYWEYGQQAAVRMGKWKAVRPAASAAWELYDLSADISESNDVAAEHSDVLEKMKAIAAEAHTPVVPGEILDAALVQKDRDYWADRPGKRKRNTGKKSKTGARANQ